MKNWKKSFNKYFSSRKIDYFKTSLKATKATLIMLSVGFLVVMDCIQVPGAEMILMNQLCLNLPANLRISKEMPEMTGIKIILQRIFQYQVSL